MFKESMSEHKKYHAFLSYYNLDLHSYVQLLFLDFPIIKIFEITKQKSRVFLISKTSGNFNHIFFLIFLMNLA